MPGVIVRTCNSVDRRFSAISVVLLIVSCSCGSGGAPSGSSAPDGPGTPSSPATASVANSFVGIVVLENTSYSEVVGDTVDAPFLNSLINVQGANPAAPGALVTNYFSDTHPSIDNYFNMTTGQAEAGDNDAFTGVVTDDNVVRELAAAQKTWKVYAEGVPSVGYLGPDYPPNATAGLYLRQHNPFAYFSDTNTNPAQAANIVPFTQFATDLAAGSLPNYAFIVPNSLDDGHDCPQGGQSCPPAQRIADSDSWLRTNLSPLLSNPAFQQNGLLIITYDEAEESDTSFGASPTGGGGHILTVLLGAHVKPAYRQQTATVYDHRSLLRSSMDALGATTPGPAANAVPLTEFLQ